jgi:hypothetical protein
MINALLGPIVWRKEGKDASHNKAAGTGRVLMNIPHPADRIFDPAQKRKHAGQRP